MEPGNSGAPLVKEAAVSSSGSLKEIEAYYYALLYILRDVFNK